MFKYLKYKSDLKKIIQFKSTLKQFHNLEEKVRKTIPDRTLIYLSVREKQLYFHEKCRENHPDYFQFLRTQLAEGILSIRGIALSIGVNVIRESYPPPIIRGAPIIPVCIFESTLEDLGYVETKYSTRFDTLDKITGVLKELKRNAFMRIFNPYNWLCATLRLPFILLRAAGFNTDKIEDELWGKVSKLFFLATLFFILLKLGFRPEDLTSVLILAIEGISLV